MRQYLVIGHRTLGGGHLMDHLHELREADPYCRFHVLVPVYHPKDRAWTEAGVRRDAEARLEEMLDRMAAMGMGAVGSVGDVSPVVAVEDLIIREGADAFSAIVLSTLPHTLSGWWDVPHRLANRFPHIALTHLVADEADVADDPMTVA